VIKLISIEWQKLRYHRFFWIGIILFVSLLSALLVSFGSFQIFGAGRESDPNDPSMLAIPVNLADAGFYTLPFVWQNTTYLAGFFKFIPAFLMLFFMASEFEYRTIRQNVIDGLSIREFFFSKVFSLLLFALVCTLTVAFTTGSLIYSYNDLNQVDFWQQSSFILAFFAEVFFILCFAFFLGLLLKKSALAIILLVLYYFAIEPILGYYLGEPISEYLPTRPSRNLIPEPFTRLFKINSFLNIESLDTISIKNLIVTFCYSFALLFAGFVVLKRRDL
jgi:ABC-2 type transport system permease protein